MIAKKKEFRIGAGMMSIFLIILVSIFLPFIGGQTGLEYLDALYNSISKGSAYYIPKVKSEADTCAGKIVEVTLDLKSNGQAEESAALFEKGGARINIAGRQLRVSGDLGQILANALDDAQKMYYNDGKSVSDKYGYNERQVLYNWWTAFKSMDRELKTQKKFREAKVVSLAVDKAVETAYNYYGISPQGIGERFGIVIFSLVFYVGYTLWYGFAIMYLFEGWGMQIGH